MNIYRVPVPHPSKIAKVTTMRYAGGWLGAVTVWDNKGRLDLNAGGVTEVEAKEAIVSLLNETLKRLYQ